MSSSFSASLDRGQERDLLARFSQAATDRILTLAARKGGVAGARSMRPNVPVGTSQPLGPYYRRNNLGHGTFRRTITSRAITKRAKQRAGDVDARTIGVVIGPIGKNAFTRHWLQYGTAHARPRPWMDRLADAATAAAREASQNVLDQYGKGNDHG